MIHWNVVTEPPLLNELTNDQLWQIVDDPAHHLSKIRFPCHTQAVERHVKLGTEASLAVQETNCPSLTQRKITVFKKLNHIKIYC
jgi:hypothetical protein